MSTGIDAFNNAIKSARNAAAQPSPTNFKGDLAIISKSGGLVIGVALHTPGSRKASDHGTEFCAKKGKNVLQLGGKDYELVASWTGAPIIEKNGKKRVLKSDETLDASKVIGIAIEGDEPSWFVTLRALA